MKKVACFILIGLFCFSGLMAKVTDVKFYSGESALSSGFGFVANIETNNDWVMNVEFNNTLGQAIFLKSFKSGFSAGPSGGIHYQTVWIAPFISYSPVKYLTFTSWPGIMAGKPQKPDWNIEFLFAYHSIDLKINKIGFGCSILNYMDYKPMVMPTINYSLSFNKNEELIMSATRDIVADRPMFLVAWKHLF